MVKGDDDDAVDDEEVKNDRIEHGAFSMDDEVLVFGKAMFSLWTKVMMTCWIKWRSKPMSMMMVNAHFIRRFTPRQCRWAGTTPCV